MWHTPLVSLAVARGAASILSWIRTEGWSDGGRLVGCKLCDNKQFFFFPLASLTAAGSRGFSVASPSTLKGIPAKSLSQHSPTTDMYTSLIHAINFTRYRTITGRIRFYCRVPCYSSFAVLDCDGDVPMFPVLEIDTGCTTGIVHFRIDRQVHGPVIHIASNFKLYRSLQ